jgi:hypothetical protein
MPSPVYRGDNPGFETQAVGNYPNASDVADKDNIFLTDEGWVYRHFKSLDKSKFWDEIIWAGDVTNPPTANDPVDAMDQENPEFLVGDGIQFVSGPYPSEDATIGASTINAASDGDTATAIPFKVNVGGTLAAPNTYTWTVNGPGASTISNATGTFTGNTPGQADTNISFAVAGVYNVTCTLKAAANASTGSVANAGFSAETNVASDTIGTVTVSGQTTPKVGAGLTYSASHTGTAPQGDLTYTWSATPNSGVQLTSPGDDPEEVKVVFQTQASVTSTVIKCVVTDSSASDSPKEGTLTVVPHFEIGNVVIAGTKDLTAGSESAIFTTTISGGSNPPANDLSYQWSATPSTGVTFSAATGSSTTVTVANTGSPVLKCVVSSAKSDPTSVTSNDIGLRVGAPATAVTLIGTLSNVGSDGPVGATSTSSARGTGLTVTYTVIAGEASNLAIVSGGSGYQTGDGFSVIGDLGVTGQVAG